MKLRSLLHFVFAVSLFSISPEFTSAQTQSTPTENDGTKLLRYPDICGERIVFCYGGDLWTVSRQGGTAIRLTAHEGLELFPKFSPDGKWIAFTGQYDGDEQIYVIPSTGGVPRQLTFYPAGGPFPPRRGYDNIVYGWTPEGKNILFRSLRDANGVTELGTLYTVSLDETGLQGALPVKVGMPTAGAGDFSPDGTKIVYSPLFRDFRSWKRYEGGWAQYLAIFDLKTKESKRIDNNPRTEREPIWIGEKIYFTSDRSGTMNLYEYDINMEQVAACTAQNDWDIRWASGDKTTGCIVFEFGGELVVYDTSIADPSLRSKRLSIHVPHDGLAVRPSRINVSKNIEDYEAAPKGKRIALIARGDLFTVPVDKGFTRNWSNSSNAHERCPVWSKDGKRLAYISDVSGEDQLYLIEPQTDTPAAQPFQLTSTFKGQLDRLKYSPCGRFLSVCDCNAKLYVVPIRDFGQFQKGIPVKVTQSKHGGLPIGSWSPCGNYLSYTLSQPQGFTTLYIWDIETKTERAVGNPMFDVETPVWDPEGKYLYYLSRREFSPQFSTVEWNFAGNRDTGIFALALQKNAKNLFGPQFGNEPDDSKDGKTGTKNEDDKTESEKSSDSETINEENDEDKKVQPTKIDWDGLSNRVVRVPIPFENYSDLSVTDKCLIYVKKDASFYGRDSERKPRLIIYDLKERKESQLADAVDGYSLASDFSKLVIHSDKTLKAYDIKAEAKPTDVKTADLCLYRIPVEEWSEIFEEVWRKFRDHFYVKNMHGYDWHVIGQKYRALLPHIAHRSDLNYVISEMIAELNVGHAYIQGGDYVQPERPKVGLPGCRLEFDPASNRYRIAKIFKGENEEPKYRSPLTEIGVDVKEGDYLLAIDGIELTGKENPYKILQHRENPITLTFNSQPVFEGANMTVYQPIFSEQNLLYLDFVRRCRDYVDKATEGRVGYLHIPDMGANGAYEFIKWYYPQIRREGLVIDVRSNGGGNISQWIIMRLNQKLLGTRFGGVKESPGFYPGNARFGHQVCLISETSASDGDIFPYYFRKSGLGPLIGKRSWGGVVGISPRGQLLDGGMTFVPLMATNDENGNWIIEGHGVDPDIEVDNDPKSMIEGRDLQLDRGIVEILRLMESKPKRWPQRPADPVKMK